MDISRYKQKALDLAMIAKEKTISLIKKIIDKFRYPNGYMKCFYWLTLIAFACYIYTWVQNGMTVPLSGDYSMQEMTFLFNGYDDWHHLFKTGEFPLWDRSVFLGIDNIGANSFYYLFDPWVLILLPFPRSWLLVLQGFEFVPKMVVAGMFFYWFLSEFKLSDKVKLIGAIAFAFSGYSFGYLWFHFISSVAFLPLCFLGVERIIRKKDPRIFLIGFFLVALTSYFFFVVYLIGLFLYAIFRYLQSIKQRDYQENMAVLGVGMIAFITAILLSAFLLLPGMVTAKSMPRVTSSNTYLDSIKNASSFTELIKALFTFPSNIKHNQVTPLLNFLFMTDGCYSSNLLNVYWYDNLANSLYATTPMLLIFFVSVFDAFKRRKVSYILGAAFMALLVFTPIGFYLFSGFTVGYARYFIIPITFMIIWDCLTLSRRREIPRTYLDLSFICVIALYAISCYLMIYEVDLNPSAFKVDETYWDLKMILIILQAVWLLACYLIMRPFFHKKNFSKVMPVLMALDIIVMANATIYGHGLSSSSKDSSIPLETEIVQAIQRDEGSDFFRIMNSDVNKNNSNLPLREGYYGLSDFHSVYPFQAQDFLDRSRIPHTYRTWSMGVYNRRINLETFLGVKYYMVDRVDVSNKTISIPKALPYRKDSSGRDVYATDFDIPYGYKDITTLTEDEQDRLGVKFSDETLRLLKSDRCDKSIYINTNFIDFAFAFDSVMNTAWLSTNSGYKEYDEDYYYNQAEDYNEYPLLRMAMLDDEDFNRFVYEKKYSAGKINFFGDNYPDIQIDLNAKMKNQASTFMNSLKSYNKDYIPYDETADYSSIELPSNPIQELSLQANNSTRVKGTIYSAQWPATDRKPSGEYASCDPNDPNSQVCLSSYKNEHPWEYENGIRPADIRYDFATLKDQDGIKKEEYTKKVLYNSKVLLTFKDGKGKDALLCPEADPNDPLSGSYVSIDSNDNIEWRLFDEDDNLICFARHPYQEYKYTHGYYVDRPVKKILGIVKAGSKDAPINLHTPVIRVIRNSDYQRAIDRLKDAKIDIIDRRENRVEFSTSFNNDKFVVLNYPLSAGFTLYKISEDKNGKKKQVEVPIYKGQGGFISFEASKGDNTFILEYETPYLKIGMMATAIGIFISLIFFFFFSWNDKEKKILLGMNLRGRVERAILQEEHKYEDCEKKR